MSGEGRTSAVKATQKLDMLGIGMRHQSDLEGGIAWRQNRDFEDLLRRLNDGTTTTETATTTTNSAELLLDSFHKARARDPESEALEKIEDDNGDGDDCEEGREGAMAKKEKKEKKKKKRKATAAEEEEVEEREDLDRKERKKKKRKKSSTKDDDDDGRAPVPSSVGSEPPPPRPSSREARPVKESGSVPMEIATATRPTTAITAPVPVRAPYVACTFRCSENQRLMYSILYTVYSTASTSIPLLARARTAPA